MPSPSRSKRSTSSELLDQLPSLIEERPDCASADVSFHETLKHYAKELRLLIGAFLARAKSASLSAESGDDLSKVTFRDGETLQTDRILAMVQKCLGKLPNVDQVSAEFQHFLKDAVNTQDVRVMEAIYESTTKTRFNSREVRLDTNELEESAFVLLRKMQLWYIMDRLKEDFFPTANSPLVLDEASDDHGIVHYKPQYVNERISEIFPKKKDTKFIKMMSGDKEDEDGEEEIGTISLNDFLDYSDKFFVFINNAKEEPNGFIVDDGDKFYLGIKVSQDYINETWCLYGASNPNELAQLVIDHLAPPQSTFGLQSVTDISEAAQLVFPQTKRPLALNAGTEVDDSDSAVDETEEEGDQ